MKNTIIKKLEELGNDVVYFDFTDNSERTRIEVDFNDFVGFDEDWCEVLREFDNPVGVEEFEKFLERNCNSSVEGFYSIYNFDGFYVQVGYTSYDI